MFTVSLPLGTCVGLGLSYVKGFDSETPAQRWLLEDFSRVDLNAKGSFWLQWQMMLCMLLGCTAMAILGIWA